MMMSKLDLRSLLVPPDALDIYKLQHQVAPDLFPACLA